MSALIRGFRIMVEKYPVTRGMISYSILWPASNLVQQSMDSSLIKYDYAEVCRYCFLGTFVNAPTVYVWVRFNSWLIQGVKLRHAAMKVRLIFFIILIIMALH